MTNETMATLTDLSRNLGIGAALPNEIALYDRIQFCTVCVDDVNSPLGLSYLRLHLFTDGERAFLRALKRIYAINEKGYRPSDPVA